MSGRKNPDMAEAEKEREYWLEQKRGYGDKVVGEGGEFLDDVGAKAEVARERDEWRQEQDEKKNT